MRGDIGHSTAVARDMKNRLLYINYVMIGTSKLLCVFLAGIREKFNDK